MKHLSHLAPEEIAGAVMLVAALVLLLARPTTVTELFASPFATPAPGGGPALTVIDASATPEMFPRPTPVTAEEAAGWIVFSAPQRIPNAPVRIDVQCGEAAVRGEPSPAPMVICVQIRSPQLGSPPVISDRARPR